MKKMREEKKEKEGKMHEKRESKKEQMREYGKVMRGKKK
jgi:hypothetical protein